MAARDTLLLLVLVLSLSQVVNSFQPLIWLGSTTHREITVRAVLRKTAEVCRDIATSRGDGFTLTIDNRLSAEDVRRACFSRASSISFLSAIREMFFENAAVDVSHLSEKKYHFDRETFTEGRQIITEGVAAVKASAKRERFQAGRKILGGILHTLQDFYSHSNWVELGKNAPYSRLIEPDLPLENLAGPNTPTCKSCTGGNCENNLLPEVLQRGLLTSGYTSQTSSAKPPGKCSHGGFFDRTSRQDPVGGINKDTVGSSHGSLHQRAADLAVDASMELLEDIRAAVGDKDFLELMGLPHSSEPCSRTGVSRRRRSPRVSSPMTKVIEDSLACGVVTVFQVVRNPGRPDKFTFTVDASLSNVTVYITGVSALTFKLVSATGKSQTSSQSSGPLASITTARNLRQLSLNTDKQKGSWEIQVDSTSQYSVEVTGESSVNFIFHLVEAHEGPHGDFSLKEGSPLSGGNISLLLSVTGGDTVKVTDVTLFHSSGSTQVKGSLQSLGGGDFLGTFSKVPAGEYVVRLSGSSSTGSFQRQAPTQITTANHSITTQVNSTSIEPGTTVNIPVTVVPIANGVIDRSAKPSYTLTAVSDRSYSVKSLPTSTSPSWVGVVSLTVPRDAESGTDVTLTIEAKDSNDVAYTVLRFFVVAEVTDVTGAGANKA